MKIALLGDIAFFGKNTINNSHIFDYYKDVRILLTQYDYVVANLETPFADGLDPFGHKSAYIYSEIQNIELLKYLGISIVNLANNHLFDYGRKSYELTKQILIENSISYFGIEKKQVLVEKDENKIAFTGYCCYSTNPLGISNEGVNELNYPDIEKTMAQNSTIGYLNILSIHAGQEHINYPNYDHIKFARKLSEIDSYVYYGHHPHVLQGIEEYNNSLIAYSLGNFCFDDIYTNRSDRPLVKQTDNNKSSIVLELEYQKNKLVNYKPIPIYAGDEKMEIGSHKINKNLDHYSLTLKTDEKEYIKMRDEVVTSLVQNRNAKRDLRWYLKRMNLRTFFVVKDLYNNKNKYIIRFKKYL